MLVDETSIVCRTDKLGSALPATFSVAIRIVFGKNLPGVHRARISYAFRVFAAIYNYRVLEDDSSEEARSFTYGDRSDTNRDAEEPFSIPVRYSPAARGRTPNLQKIRYSGEDFFLFYGLDPSTRQPDWLGEIFEWLSSGHETGITERDSIGRIPDSELIFERIGLATWKPQAAMLMAWLQHACCNGNKQEGLAKAPSPVPGIDHLVICSHDIDFYFTSRRSAAVRLVKNLAISCLLYKSAKYFLSNIKMLARLLMGKRIGDYLPILFERMEQLGCRSTLFVVASRSHRRDPNYDIAALAVPISEAMKKGFSVEIHGCYQSVLEKGSLKADKQALAAVTGRMPLGNRQHWLRFGDAENVFRVIEDADLRFDSSLGFSDTVGFRNGASFAYPPYDFKRECARKFLEFPLAIMDGGLVERTRATGESAQVLAERVLQESRRFGWGGISILWHNPLEALSVPDEINDVFWKCAEGRTEFREEWISSDEFLALSRARYQNAGLLTE